MDEFLKDTKKQTNKQKIQIYQRQTQRHTQKIPLLKIKLNLAIEPFPQIKPQARWCCTSKIFQMINEEITEILHKFIQKI